MSRPVVTPWNRGLGELRRENDALRLELLRRPAVLPEPRSARDAAFDELLAVLDRLLTEDHRRNRDRKGRAA